MSSTSQFARVLLVASFVLVLVFLVYGLQKRDRRGVPGLVVMFVGLALWLLGDIVLAFTTGPIPDIGPLLVLFGADIAVPGVFVFALAYTGREHLVNRKTATVLAINPVGTLLVFLSSYWNQLIVVTRPETVQIGYVFELTPYFLLSTGYNWVLVALTIGLLGHMMSRARYAYRRQIVAMTFAFAVPGVLNVLVHLGPIPLDITSISFLVTTSVLMYAVFRLRLMDTVPVARKTVLEEMDAMVFLLDEHGRIETVNNAVEETFGTEQELAGTQVTQVLGEEVPTETESSGGRNHEITTTVDGERRYLTVNRSLLTDYRETLLGQLLVCRDVTQRTRRERELQQYTELVQTVGDPMYVLDDEGYYERVNDAFVEFTGYDRSEIVGNHVKTIVMSSDFEAATALLQNLIEDETKKWETVELRGVTADGEEVITEAQITPIFDEAGDFVGSVGSLRDIRERKQREQDLELLKDILTRVFRHNVRNDLMVVQNHARLIERSDDGDSSEHVSKILDASERLLEHSEKARLIEQVIHTDELVETDLTHTVDRVVHSLTTEYPDAKIATDLTADATVMAHPEIAKGIKELIENAIQHTPDGAIPEVSIRIDQQSAVTTVYIEDAAGGLADHEIEVLREESESDLKHGSGVGLWLVRWLVEYSDAELLLQRTSDGTQIGVQFHNTTDSEPEPAVSER